MNKPSSRIGGGRKLLHSKSVEIEHLPAANTSSDEELEVTHKPGLDDGGPGTKKLLKRRSCLVIGGHAMAEYEQSSESYLFSLLKPTLGYELPISLSSPPAGENGVRSHGDHPLAEQNGALSLHDFARLYYSRLPITVHMTSGTAPPPPHPSPVVDVLSMTHAPVVVCIYKDLQLFQLPLDAEMLFAPLYDPCDDLNLAVVGMVFYGVTSVIHSNPMPKVVCARSRWKHYDTSVHVGEILIVKGMHVKGGQVRGLSVFSMSTRADKTLPLKCQLQLTTQPKYLFLSLSDIVAHVPDAFPCKACVLGNADGPPAIMEGNASNVVTLNEVTRATVLTCSVTREGQPTIVCTIPVALPDVHVVVSPSMTSHVPGLCGEGHGQAKVEEVWECIDEAAVSELTSVPPKDKEVWERVDKAAVAEQTSVPLVVGTVTVDGSHGRRADDRRQLAAPLSGQSQGNLKQAVGIDRVCEDVDRKADNKYHIPDIVIAPAKPAPTQAQGHKESKRIAKKDPDYEDVDNLLTNAPLPTMGKMVGDSNLHVNPVPRHKGYKGMKQVDEEGCEAMDDEDVFLANLPTETSVTPDSDSRHGRAGGLVSSVAQSKPFSACTESGQRDFEGLKVVSHVARDWAKVNHTPDELAVGGGEGSGCIKPRGWIYMSGNYEGSDFDAECDEDTGFERCNSSVLREDDERIDTDHGDLAIAKRARGGR